LSWLVWLAHGVVAVVGVVVVVVELLADSSVRVSRWCMV
jgi:hypothetical protein